jgi:hypothetical protein
MLAFLSFIEQKIIQKLLPILFYPIRILSSIRAEWWIGTLQNMQFCIFHWYWCWLMAYVILSSKTGHVFQLCRISLCCRFIKSLFADILLIFSSSVGNVFVPNDFYWWFPQFYTRVNCNQLFLRFSMSLLPSELLIISVFCLLSSLAISYVMCRL